jgi:glycosyltransferase involved in cell wall biosynthesis
MIAVAVMVDLERGPRAGGHVRVWERLAEAAADLPRELDLTVHFSGSEERETPLADHVRIVEHRPIFSTARLGFLPEIPAHTDLASFHRGLARRLAVARVLHTTDAYFAFAKTAVEVAKRRGLPLVNSVHTDTPSYTRLFTAATIERVAPRPLRAVLVERLRLPARAEARMEERLREHQRRCAFAFVSRPEQAASLATLLSPRRVGVLRRGIDRTRFHPRARDLGALADRFGVPRDKVLVLYVGRLDRTKSVLCVADAVRTLRSEGEPVHLVCVGEGPDRAEIAARLGADVTFTGMLEGEALVLAFASADLFVQPSQTEESSNVVLEALTSGLPVVVAARQGASRRFPAEVADTVTDEARWPESLRGLVQAPARRAAMSKAARAFAERAIPSWHDVLTQDLLPVWQKVAVPS